MSVPLCLTDLTMHKVYSVQFISVQSLGCVWLCNPMNHSPPGLSVHQQLRVYPNSCPLSRWCHLTISSSAVPFSSCLQSFSTSGSFQMSQLFSSGGQNIGVSASTSVLSMNTQDWSLSDGLVGSPCNPRDSQESSPTPLFKSINSSVLSFLHSPTLLSIHYHGKNHSPD